jgi:glycosyltransferase involved in cell wall biosynthesis
MNHKKMGALEKLLRRINTRIAGALAGSFDSYAFFASAMTEAIDVHGRPNIVVEGCVDDKAELPPAAADPAPMGERYMLYTGALEAEYGIGMLMEAFDKCADKQIQLYICGRGGYTDAVEKAAAVNGRIHYLGMLALDKVHQLQRSATILVNPRPATSAFTRYSFPSKNLEYLASGRPTVYYVLPGMAEEYSSYAFVPDACSADSMARTFDHVLATPAQELAAKGALAAEFVSREKSSTAQGKRLYELIQQLI